MRVLHENQTINTTLGLIQDGQELMYTLTVAKIFPDSPKFSRLSLWLDFFNDSFSNVELIHYNQTIAALVHVWSTNDLLQSQTAHEFELSKQFYTSFFLLSKRKKLVDKETSKKLLVLSFIFSRYHGMMRCSFNPLFTKQEMAIRDVDIDLIVEKVFVKYEVPGYLISNFEHMTAAEIQFFMELLQGENLFSHPLFPSAITRREFARLSCFKTSLIRFKFTDHIVLRGGIAARLMKNNSNEGKLYVYLSASSTFMKRPELYFSDLDFWERGFTLLTDDEQYPEVHNLTNCVDFLEYKKYLCDEPFSLNGRTKSSLTRMVNEWHDTVYRLNFDEFRKKSWEKSPISDLEFTYKNKKYLCKELNSGELLYKEGEKLKHCVVTYTPQCESGYCTIWSMKAWCEVSKTYRTFLTIEVTNGEIVQARGRFNHTPDKKERNVLLHWAKKLELNVELIKNE